ncbi:MAG TPA: protein adenylyltransferase SelO family protein [Gallionellaceae bacterium]|nr:protein adenylyltransferase SelO family protein [Gallionellaceae bacterium]
MSTSAPLTFSAFLQRADYSLLQSLTADPEQARHVPNKRMREVKSGHYVEVEPTPLPNPRYVIHSRSFFDELNLPGSLATEAAFMQFFTGNPALAVNSANADIEPQRIRTRGWASGYALSIYGQEMVQNCPFNTGNGYGDGRAISVLEVLLANKQCWEFQLKGGGTTPYCRGGDGRAILRSSIREFRVSEAMAALGVPTTRALCLYVSQSETITRPWYSPNAKTQDPDRRVNEPAAITTRVAPSFLRVGQLELFGRRARKNEHPNALPELEAIFLHTLDREYPYLAAQLHQANATLTDKVLAVAREFAVRLSQLVAHWIRVGYCQGNFNSDNCALGGRTLDYGPFGFIEAYDPAFQMWTGGGEHFSFMNQPMAAMENFRMFCIALVPLLEQDESAIQSLQEILDELPEIMQREMNRMWANKMGLAEFDAALFTELHALMAETPVDYTLFWRELCNLPQQAADLRVSFYETRGDYAQNSAAMETRWAAWLQKWHTALAEEARNPADVSAAMKRTNPKYIPREWMLVEAYRSATDADDFTLVHKLHNVLEGPYSEQSEAVAALSYKKKEEKFFNLGGTSHCSCSS